VAEPPPRAESGSATELRPTLPQKRGPPGVAVIGATIVANPKWSFCQSVRQKDDNGHQRTCVEHNVKCIDDDAMSRRKERVRPAEEGVI
jgi:hypothetical protein